MTLTLNWNRNLTSSLFLLAALSPAVVGCGAMDGDLVGADESTQGNDITTVYPAGSRVRTTASLNLRSGPSISDHIITVMPAGSVITLEPDPGPTNGFYHVLYRTFEGYASGRYLSVVSIADAGTESSDAGDPDAATTVDAATDAGTTPDTGTGTTAGPWDPHSGRPPSGKGVWIWYFDRLGLTPAAVAARCVSMGVGYVLIKSGQDATFWNTRYNAATVSEFTSRGIQVFAWPYITPSNISGSIGAAVQAAQVPGTSGVIIDAEIEFEGSHAAAAQQLCEGIRAGAPGVFLGYTSFGWVGYHGTFPFSTFDRYCGDAFMPQVYWSDRGISWSAGYSQAADMITAAGLHAPVWMIQSNDNTPSGTAPSTADLNAFYAHGDAFTSLWEWPASTDSAKVAQLSSLNWSN